MGTSSDTELNRVIIMTPLGTEEDRKNFMGKTILVSGCLEECIGSGNYMTRPNYKKGHLVLTLKDSIVMERTKLIQMLGPYRVTCKQPEGHTMTYGVIHPVGLENDIEEIQEALRQREGQELVVPERMYAYDRVDKTRKPSRSIKLQFSGGKLPQYI